MTETRWITTGVEASEAIDALVAERAALREQLDGAIGAAKVLQRRLDAAGERWLRVREVYWEERTSADTDVDADALDVALGILRYGDNA